MNDYNDVYDSHLIIDSSLLGNPYFLNIIMQLHAKSITPVVSNSLYDLLLHNKSEGRQYLDFVSSFSIDGEIFSNNLDILINEELPGKFLTPVTKFLNESPISSSYENCIMHFQNYYSSNLSNRGSSEFIRNVIWETTAASIVTNSPIFALGQSPPAMIKLLRKNFWKDFPAVIIDKDVKKYDSAKEYNYFEDKKKYLKDKGLWLLFDIAATGGAPWFIHAVAPLKSLTIGVFIQFFKLIAIDP